MGWCLNILVALVAIASAFIYTYHDNIRETTLVLNGYGAKVACSIVYVSGRSLDSALNTELVFPPVKFFATFVQDEEKKCVTASVASMETSSTACYFSKRYGCRLVHSEADVFELPADDVDLKRNYDAVYPLGEKSDQTEVEKAQAKVDMATLKRAANQLFEQTILHVRGLLVIKDGAIIHEQYGDGATVETPMLGWSMTKSWLGTLVGRMIHEGTLPDGLDTKIDIPEWKGKKQYKQLTVKNLLQMTDSLDFDEIYFPGSDAPDMLFVQPTVSLEGKVPLRNQGKPCWQYSSYTTNLLSRFLLHVFTEKLGKTHKDYLSYPWDALFKPLGMNSATFETDPKGILVGSSFGWATLRDWGRFGLLYLNNGTIADGNGGRKRLLPEYWTDFVSQPSPVSLGVYGAHWWRSPIGYEQDPEDELKRCNDIYPTRINPDRSWMGYSFPEGTYMANGFEQQYVVVMPKSNAVIVLLGATKEMVVNNPMVFDRKNIWKNLTHSLL